MLYFRTEIASQSREQWVSLDPMLNLPSRWSWHLGALMPATLLRAVGSVLIVDDDKALLASLKRRFEAKEWIALTAMRGPEAVELARQHRPTVVVLDLQLEDEYGMDLIAPLLTASPRSRIAVLTGYADIPTTNEALQLGAKVLLSKPGGPIQADEILRALDIAHERAQHTAAVMNPLPDDERREIEEALRQCRGNKSAAAKRLGIDRRTLIGKLRRIPRRQE
jgi:two-component system response regulator RegA